MKKLYLFSIRSFAGPFIVTFFVAMFILIMQVFWLYVDDLIGKGLAFSVIMKLMFYVSMSVIPLAMPLAILLSSIMTFGNLGENNELTALKSAGLSIFKIIKPLFVVVCFISVFIFLFSNYVIPRANLKWHALMSDIQNTKVTSLLKPGSYTTELEGYAIKIERENKGQMFDITIHDHTDPIIAKTVKAKSGEIFKAQNGKFLFFKLNNGSINEELITTPPVKLPNGEIKPNYDTHFRPSRRTTFATATYKMDLSGFQLEQSEDGQFSNAQEMMNVFQISKHLDSVQRVNLSLQAGFVMNLKNNHPYFNSKRFIAPAENSQTVEIEKVNIDPNLVSSNPTMVNDIQNTHLLASSSLPKHVNLDTVAKEKVIVAMQSAAVLLRNQKGLLQSQLEMIRVQEFNFRSYSIEFHRKFALSAAILVLFFVGAPLGAIVKRGGFGLPVVIAALLFMLYFVLISIGENMARSGVIPCAVGMWSASVVLAPIAIWLMYTASKDQPLIDKERWMKLFTAFKRKAK